MTIKDFLNKLSPKLEIYLPLPFFLVGQNEETKSLEKWGTFQVVDVEYKLTNQGNNKDGTHRKIWKLVLQININCKYNNTTPNAFESLDLMSKIVHYLSKEYYYEDELEVRKHYPIEISVIRDLPTTENQKSIYSKSIDITFRGEETFIFESVEINKVSGEITEYPSGLKEPITSEDDDV